MTSMRHLNNRVSSYGLAKLHTGELVEGLSRAHLRKQVARRLMEMNHAVDNFERYFENAVCEALPPEVASRECRYVDNESPDNIKQPRVTTSADVWRFVRAMKNWVSDGGGFVDASEAERRAAICAQCPRNVEAAGCNWCSGVLGAALDLIAGRTTKVDHQLKSCEVCGCANRAAVHFPDATIDRSLEYPAWCWKADVKSF